MEEVVAGMGIFQINATHGQCARCDQADIHLEKREYYCNNIVCNDYRVVCEHMNACKRMYESRSKHVS